MHDDAKIIHANGGPTAVARLLGYRKNGAQRVHNWLSRGIPARVKLDHPDVFLSTSPAPKVTAEA